MGRSSRRVQCNRCGEAVRQGVLHDCDQAVGNCYDAAVDLMKEMHGMLDKWPHAQATLRVVHATVTGQGPIAGIRMGHAWVEYGDVAYDMSNGAQVVLPKQQYRALAKAGNVQEYDYLQVLTNLVRHRHYGPWDE